jgi:metal-dependent amidase/aminoacylase/carboxypeptidase family protein
VSTFGLWDIKPNFYNAVPRSVRVDIDIRDSDKERRDGIISATLEGAEQIAARRKCGYSGEVKFEYPIAKSDKKVISLSFLSLQLLFMCCQPLLYLAL